MGASRGKSAEGLRPLLVDIGRGCPEERIDNLNALVVPTVLEVFAEQETTSLPFRRGQNQAIPIRQLCSFHPVPGALNEINVYPAGLPLAEGTDRVPGRGRGDACFAYSI